MKTGKYLFAFFALAIAFVGCKNEEEKNLFDNHLYISSDRVVDDILFKVDIVSDTRTLSVRLAQPMDRDVEVTFEVRPDLAAEYNMIHGDNARLLPEKYYNLSSLKSLIRAGSVLGEDITVDFSDINELNMDFRYVLPVRIVDSDGAPVLETGRTTYFVLRKGALINVVADISKLKMPINWSAEARPMVTGTNAFTVELLMRSSKWDMNGNPMGLGSVFGQEGFFLVRIGDAGYGPNQPQIVDRSSGTGNWPSATASPQLPVNKWVHFAFVWDGVNKTRAIYINGVEAIFQSSAPIGNTLNLASGMAIGYAFEDARYLPCEVAEYRVWNVARTESQLAGNMLALNPELDGEGLVAYWKFNDGAGNVIHDYSGNGTDLTTQMSNVAGNTKSSPVWNPVEMYTEADF